MVGRAGSVASRAGRHNGVERTVSSDDGDDGNGKLPRQTTSFFGHGDAEQALLEAYRSGRFPHAWLVGGPPGIGKATLAYRMARFVLADPDPRTPGVQRATSLAGDPSQPVARPRATTRPGRRLGT